MFAGPWPFALLVAVFIGAGAWEWVRMCDRASFGFMTAGLAAMILAGAALVWLDRSRGEALTLWVLGMVWATDIGAYAVGSTVRGPRIAPSISPNKTWSGLAGGMALAAVWSLGWSAYFGPSQPDAAALAVLAAAGAVVAQTGDFALSFAKRRFGRKDSSGLIPGHGGVLDRIAGLLTTAPALALLLLVNKDNIRGSW